MPPKPTQQPDWSRALIRKIVPRSGGSCPAKRQKGLKRKRPSAGFPGLKTASRHLAAGARSHPAEYKCPFFFEVVLFLAKCNFSPRRPKQAFSGHTAKWFRSPASSSQPLPTIKWRNVNHPLMMSFNSSQRQVFVAAAWPTLCLCCSAAQWSFGPAIRTWRLFVSSKKKQKELGTHGLEHPKNPWIEEEG